MASRSLSDAVIRPHPDMSGGIGLVKGLGRNHVPPPDCAKRRSEGAIHRLAARGLRAGFQRWRCLPSHTECEVTPEIPTGATSMLHCNAGIFANAYNVTH